MLWRLYCGACFGLDFARFAFACWRLRWRLAARSRGRPRHRQAGAMAICCLTMPSKARGAGAATMAATKIWLGAADGGYRLDFLGKRYVWTQHEASYRNIALEVEARQLSDYDHNALRRGMSAGGGQQRARLLLPHQRRWLRQHTIQRWTQFAAHRRSLPQPAYPTRAGAEIGCACCAWMIIWRCG